MKFGDFFAFSIFLSRVLLFALVLHHNNPPPTHRLLCFLHSKKHHLQQEKPRCCLRAATFSLTLPTPPKRKDDEEQSKTTRIAIVNPDLCKPKKCSLECKRCCPINLQGKHCIEVEPSSKTTTLSEEHCIGCGLCQKRCPFKAITIINVPSNLDSHTMHRYGPNSFKLHRLPLPRPGAVLGLVGPNGTGKSTALGILKGRLKPNLGRFRNEPTWEEIVRYFRGSEHQSYFKRLLEDKVKALLKPQYVDTVPRQVKGTVREILTKQDERKMMDHFVEALDLKDLLDSDIAKLSGGELQRFTIAVTCNQAGEVYMFDEPSSYLDVSQRIKVGNVIRSLVREDNYIVCVEHDLAVVDYLSDYVCVLYGRPGLYGIVTAPFGCREGINVFLDGFVPTENMRFREEGLNFRLSDEIDDGTGSKHVARYQYPSMKKQLGKFHLTVTPGEFTDSEIVVLLGENGCGKTTLIRMLAGHEKPDSGGEVPQLAISYKPQKIAPKFQGSVRDLLQTKILAAFSHAQFVTDVLKPMRIEEILDLEVQNLSGGELQRVGITLALGTPANVYLLDEPSAYLDSDQRIITAKVIKRFILHAKKTAFIVEHDFVMATYLADRVIVYDGTPARDCTASAPTDLLTGMNKFLKGLDITIRRDPFNFRPRINKHNSVKDREQKACGNYFYMMEKEEAVKEGCDPAEAPKAAKKPAGKAAKQQGQMEAMAAAKAEMDDSDEEDSAPKMKTGTGKRHK